MGEDKTEIKREEKYESVFEKKIKPILKYVGTIGAVLMMIAYILTVVVLVLGFKVEAKLNLTVFAIINAAVGILIMTFMKIQGIDFAKDLPANKIIIEKYYGTKTKDKKEHSITYFWITSTLKDVITKGITLAGTSIGVVILVIEGSKDYKLLMLAAVNLIMFICFGLKRLVDAYDFYNEYHVKYMKDRLAEASIPNREGVKTECLNTETKNSEIYKNKF